jgi:hypothetical protein
MVESPDGRSAQGRPLSTTGCFRFAVCDVQALWPCGKLSEPAEKTSRLIFGPSSAALLVKRSTGDASQMKDVVLTIKSQLQG